MWFLCFLFFTFSSAFPFGDFRGVHRHYNFQLAPFQTRQYHRFCVPSPFLGQICVPLPFIPYHPPTTPKSQCFPLPLITSYTIKICPGNAETSSEENSKELAKEIMKRVEEEKEEEVLVDNANIEVKEEEVEPEKFVRKVNVEKSEELKMKEEENKRKNKIIRILEKIMEAEKRKNSKTLDFSEENSKENVSITSNLL